MEVYKDTLYFKRFMIPYRMYGTSKTCLLCINGAQMNMGAWKLFIKHFSKKYRVVLFDFPQQGMGKILSRPFSISFEEQLECVERVVDQIPNCDSLYTASTSWGAVIALAYSAQHPDQIDKQIIGSLAIESNEKLDEITRQGIDFYKKEQGNKVGSLLASGLGGNIPDTLRRQIELQFKRIGPKQAEAFYHHVLFVQKARLEDLVDFSKITTTTLLVYGEKDEVCTVNDGNFLKKHIKNSHLNVIKGIGHYLSLEDASVIEIFDDFFASSHTPA
jgi:pimeloyl-ACP methyl ester carboxylesterase